MVAQEDERVTRMRILRLILAGVVSIGLVLTPIAVTNAMGLMQSAMTDAARTAKSTSPTEKSCPCCDVGKCFAVAMCTMSCMQFGPASDLNFRAAPIGHAALRGIAPAFHQGLTQHPPIPPPRA
jgi:hypothetical protein